MLLNLQASVQNVTINAVWSSFCCWFFVVKQSDDFSSIDFGLLLVAVFSFVVSVGRFFFFCHFLIFLD